MKNDKRATMSLSRFVGAREGREIEKGRKKERSKRRKAITLQPENQEPK